MEKKYLIGYVYGREAVMWDDVKDFEESFDEETGLKTIKFKENNIEYVYTGNEIRGYREQNNKSPFITDYKLIGRRTALRHDYLDDTKRREARPLNNNDYDEDDYDEDDFDEDEDDFITRNGNRVILADDEDYYSSCGESEYREISGCGGSTVYRRGVCGG